MGKRTLLAYCGLACALVAAGCDSGDLGECNLDGKTTDDEDIPGPAAFDLAYRASDGLPMFEGQAIFHASCGNGQFCHTPNASGGDRFGSPAGLNFDVGLACNSAISADCTSARLQQLEASRSYTASWGEGIISEIRGGTMPPGAAGRQVMDERDWLRADGSPLPKLGVDDSVDIVRNWLACGAPVVARTEPAPSVEAELSECDSIEGEVCIYSGPTAPLPDPTWSSIYDTVILPQCVGCHQPGGVAPFLDLTGEASDMSDWASAAHAALVGVSVSPDPAAACFETQGINVIAGDSEGSLMIQKMRAEQSCGQEMPIAGGVQTIPDSVIAVIAQWIDGGAPND